MHLSMCYTSWLVKNLTKKIMWKKLSKGKKVQSFDLQDSLTFNVNLQDYSKVFVHPK